MIKRLEAGPRMSQAVVHGNTVYLAGQVADGVGFNTYVLRTTKNMHMASGARMARTGATYKFATAQDHKIVSEVATATAAARVPESRYNSPLDG